VSLTKRGRRGGTSAARLDTRTDDGVSGAE